MFSHQQTISHHTRVNVVQLPLIPTPIQLEDLDANFRLISKEEHERLLTLNLPDSHICKKVSGCKYVLIKIDGELHAVYFGKHLLGRGMHGKVKLAQNVQTGKWEACKIVYSGWPEDLSKPDHESRMLELAGNLIHTDENHTPLQLRNHLSKNKLYKTVYFTELALGKELKYINHFPAHYFSAIEYLEVSMKFINKLKALHLSYIAHRDLNNGNIMYNTLTRQLTLIDYGNARSNAQADEIAFDLELLLGQLQIMLRNNIWLDKHADPTLYFLYNTVEEIEKNTTEYAYQLIEPLYDRLIDELTALKAKLPRSEKTYQIGLLDIGDFDAAAIDVGNLRQYSEIWLVDRRNTGTMNDYLKCRQQLEKNHLVVGDKVFKHPSRLGLNYHVTRMLRERFKDCYFEVREAISGRNVEVAKRVRCQPTLA